MWELRIGAAANHPFETRLKLAAFRWMAEEMLVAVPRQGTADALLDEIAQRLYRRLDALTDELAADEFGLEPENYTKIRPILIDRSAGLLREEIERMRVSIDMRIAIAAEA